MANKGKYTTVLVSERRDKEMIREIMTKNMKSTVISIFRHIAEGRSPSITYSETKVEVEEKNESTPEVETSTIRKVEKKRSLCFESPAERKKMTLMMHVMHNAHSRCVSGDNTLQKRRSVFYSLQESPIGALVENQKTIDSAIKETGVMLKCSEADLGYVPSAKGLAAGKLKLELDDGRVIDFKVTPGGALITQDIHDAKTIKHKVRRVIVVEKDTIFNKLLEENCPQRLQCVLVTGKGFPDVVTREFVKMLSEVAKLPVYILVDGNPDGIEIFCTYRYGSRKQKKDLSCQEAKWIGIFPSELGKLSIKRTSELTTRDREKLSNLQKRSYVSAEIKRELELMKTAGKIQIDAISEYSKDFLTSQYLPRNIKNKINAV